MRTTKQNNWISIGIVLTTILIGGISYGQTFTHIDTSIVCTVEGDSKYACWGDFNNDNFDDLIIINGMGDADAYVPFIFINEGDWNFTQITDSPITTDTLINGSLGASWGDYNNDGHLDLFLACYSNEDNLLYKNNGDGSFSKITEGPMVTDSGWTAQANWVDVNTDGYLDLYTVNRAWQKNFLYINNGNEGYRYSKQNTVSVAPLDLSSSWADFDNDGDLDLYGLTMGDGQRYLLINDGNGNFTPEPSSGLTNLNEASWGWHSPSWADYDNDGFLDVFSAAYGLNWSDENDMFFHNLGNGTFEKITNGSPVSEKNSTDGSCWADLNNDGFVDLIISTFYSNSTEVYMNSSSGTFTPLDSDVLNNFGGHVSITDMNRDGFLDLLIVRGYYNPPFINSLLANDGNSNSWINIKLVGAVSNKSAIGTRVKAKANIGGTDIWQIRETGLTQHSLNAHFGFGDATLIDSLIIQWPSDHDTVLTDVDVNQFITITELIPSGYLNPSFYVDTAFGRGELTVQFTDISKHDPLKPITSWSWDFNNDGTEDSAEQNPIYTFSNEAGEEYDVGLTISNGTDTAKRVQNGLIKIQKTTPGIDDDLTNWAITATTSSIESPYFSALEAIDNIRPTRWGSQHGSNNEWLCIELNNIYNVGKVVIDWETAYGKEYKIAVSEDNITWDTVFCECESNGGMDTVYFTGADAKYVKLIGQKRATSWGFSIYELEIFQSDGNDYESNCDAACGAGTNVNTTEQKSILSVYPNPIYNTIYFTLELQQTSHVTAILYDITGRKVANIYNGAVNSGQQTFRWQRENLSQGIYFYELSINTNNQIQKLTGKILIID